MADPAASPNPGPQQEQMANKDSQTYELQILRRDLKETYPKCSELPAVAPYRGDLACASSQFFNTVHSGYYPSLKDDPISKTPDGKQGTPVGLGLLLSGGYEASAYLDAEVLVTTLNSGDQAPKTIKDRQMQVQRNISENRPMAVIVQKDSMASEEDSKKASDKDSKRKASGKGFPLFPCTLENMREGEYPNEDLESWPLGWFMPLYMWALRAENGKPIYQIIMSKMALAEHSFWANPDHAHPPKLEDRDFTIMPEVEDCSVCSEQSLRLFKENFVCLNQECPAWCKSGGKFIEVGKVDDKGNVIQHWTYTDCLLQERFDPRTPVEAPVPAYPDLYEPFTDMAQRYTEQMKIFQDDMAHNRQPDQQVIAALCKSSSQGFQCPDCSRLNSRVRWDGWSCSKKSCGFYFDAPPPYLTPEFLKRCSDAEDEKRKWKNLDPTKQAGYQGSEKIDDYTFDHHHFGDEDGGKYGISHGKPGTEAMRWCDDLLARVQEEIGTGRTPIARRRHNTQLSTTLTNHFTVNTGTVYTYRAHVPTIAFEDAPLFKEATEHIGKLLQDLFQIPEAERPNQCYIAAYTPGSSMNYHSDRALGKIVISVTSGGSCTFVIGIKKIFDYGRAEEGKPWITDDPVVVGCLEYEYRREIKDKLIAGEITQAEWQKLFEARMSKLKMHKPRTPRPLAKFHLKHGDICIMNGKLFQEYFKHCAEVNGQMPLRIALTFRTVQEAMTVLAMLQGSKVTKRGNDAAEAGPSKKAKTAK